MSFEASRRAVSQSVSQSILFLFSCLDVQLVPAVEVPEEEDALDGEGERAGGQVQVGRHGGGRHVVEIHELEDAGEPEEGEHGHVLPVVNLQSQIRGEW